MGKDFFDWENQVKSTGKNYFFRVRDAISPVRKPMNEREDYVRFEKK